MMRNVVQKFMNKNYADSKYGSLGTGIWMNIPDCVLQNIREANPEEDGNYRDYILNKEK
jgi:hypothetical protein